MSQSLFRRATLAALAFSALFLNFKAARSAEASQTGNSGSVTVTGKVVDAACFMMHPPAASAGSHAECGAACLVRGVPLAIAADDGTLYFPADGNQRLKSL